MLLSAFLQTWTLNIRTLKWFFVVVVVVVVSVLFCDLFPQSIVIAVWKWLGSDAVLLRFIQKDEVGGA